MYNGSPTPLDVLTEPLTVQLLSGPGTVAFEITLPAVVVLPTPNPDRTLFELQLGLFDFCQLVEVDRVPYWASQFTYLATGYQFALPVIAPPPPHAQVIGTSTFHITQESYEEVRGFVADVQGLYQTRFGQLWPLISDVKDSNLQQHLLHSLNEPRTTNTMTVTKQACTVDGCG